VSALAQRKRILSCALVLAFAAAASASARAPKVVQITISAMTFAAPSGAIKAGDTIEWINKDIVDHTATEKKGGLWNVSIAPGKSAKVVVKKAGTFDYYCRYHPNMVARISVH
jgi:plastocyanin